MANEIRDAREGLARALSRIEGLRVYKYPPQAGLMRPCVIIHFVQRESDLTLGGSSTVMLFDLMVYVGTLDTEWAWKKLDNYLDPLGPDSIEAAIDADNTLDGNVDDARVQFPMGHRQEVQMVEGGQEYYMSTVPVRIVKQVTS